MGNNCSRPQQPDSIRVQQYNNPKLDGRPMSIWGYNAFPNPFPETDNSSLYDNIYLGSFYNPQSGCFCGHLFIEKIECRNSFFFFKFENKPTKITIQKQTNGELKISFIGDENCILFEQVWLSSEYKLSEDGSDLITIVKKKMIENVSSNVQIDNGAEASASQSDVQPLLDGSHDNGSGTLASNVQIDNGAEASASQYDVRPLSVNSHDDWSATHASKNVESNRSASNTLDLVSSESHEQLCSQQDFHTEIARVKVVKSFKDQRYTYMVRSKRIEFSIGLNTFSVEFGIPFNSIKKILVYEIEESLFLIVIQTFDSQVYLSGYSGTSSSPIFVTTQITSHISFGQLNLFKSIEFDSSNSLHFHINMTNCKKMFSIDNCNGSIRQLDCQWKNL
jgi:hypothetical protein